MAFWDLIGIGALNWDLIYELDDLQRLEDLGISLRPGEETHLSGRRLDPLIELLDRYGKKRAGVSLRSMSNHTSWWWCYPPTLTPAN